MWNDLDFIKNARTVVMWGAAICSVLSVVFHSRTNTLLDIKEEKKRIENQINSELAKAKTEYVSMKSGDIDGMTSLLNKFNNSPHNKVKDEVKKYLDMGNVYFFQKTFYKKTDIPKWEDLAKIDSRTLDFYKERLTGGAKDLSEITTHLTIVNMAFGKDFKIYEVNKINDWFNNNDHLKMVKKAKAKIEKE